MSKKLSEMFSELDHPPIAPKLNPPPTPKESIKPIKPIESNVDYSNIDFEEED